MIKFTVPVKTVNEQNFDRGNSRLAAIIKSSRRKKQRAAALLLAKTHFVDLWLPMNRTAVVTLRRISVGKLDDDGLRTALKSVRDGIADALGIDDGSPAISWQYEQGKGKRGVYAVEVEIMPNQEQTREALP